jgi:mono/diheme cytochrome c family protein
MIQYLWLLPFLPGLAAPAVPAGTVEYNRDIRPILSENCFACHGPDKPKRKADLRLDNEEGAFADLGGRFALVAGKPADSELYRRITAADRHHMPPASTGKALTRQQVELIRQWIEQGAKYQKHWSFIVPTRFALPSIRDGRWSRGAIDRFILARLEAEGVKPSPAADRRVLLRRLSFDLVGLPPAPEEVDAFLADTSDKAYEKAVDRLLASTHFGERMALYWLDLVRFADTAGYHSDNHRDVALYRDYVIAAFNRNKPFDQFTVEQLAGDLLPDAGSEQRVASGYNRLLQTTEEGGAQAKEYLAKYAADRVRNAGSVWLGLTLGCAECHNHKFDPIATREFYRFASFWADIREVAVGRQPQTKVPTAEQALQLRLIEGDLAAARKALATTTPTLAAAQRLWEEQAQGKLDSAKTIWSAVKPTRVVSSGGTTLTVGPDFSVLRGGKEPAKDTCTVTLTTDRKGLTGIRLAALRHPSLKGGGLSRGNGNFVLTGFKVSLLDREGKPQPVKLAAAAADFAQPGFPVASLLSSGPGWAVEGHVRKNVDRQAVFTFAQPIPGGPNTTLVVRLEQTSIYPQHNIGRFRLDLTSAEKPAVGGDAGLPDPVALVLAADPTKRTAAQRDTLAAYYRTIAPTLAPVRRKVAELEQKRQAIEQSMPQTLVSMTAPPRTMRVLPRGNWLDDRGEVVEPGTPTSLPGLGVTGRRATRLDLANWLTGKDNPLTARVFVNRLWKLFFGQGLVTSLEDFGSQGTWPSHPELLDWLAVEFRESGWDVKHLVRLLVTSSTYRQVSTAGPALRQRDPYNRLLARQGRFRLDAEMVRDNALAVSGLLVRKVGGSSVKPYQPGGYWAYLNFPRREYVEDRGADQYRRGLYTYVQRTFPHPSLTAFDAPSREECTVERPRSNTPQQALVLLNDPTYVEAARKLAEKTLREGGRTDGDRLVFLYRRVLGRPPRPAEAEVLLPLLARHLKQYQTDRAAAAELLAVGQAVTRDAERPTLAAWTSLARVLLNLHETITRE